jgi:hypothetical protein
MNKHRNYSQKGGLGFGDAIKADLLSKHPTGKITDIDIIRLLLSDVNECRILSDKSNYSFVFKLTMQNYTLVDTYGKDLLDTVDVPGFDQQGPPIKSICCKMAFASDPPVELDQYTLANSRPITKFSVLPGKAMREGDTQNELWKYFSCKSSSSAFVPDVIAQTILSDGEEFKRMFERILLGDSPTPTREQLIYKYIMFQLTKGVHIHVFLMEMLDIDINTGMKFVSLRSLQHYPEEHKKSSLRISAQIVSTLSVGFVPHDVHEENAFVLPDGSKTYIIDWGGTLCIKKDKTDRDMLLRCLGRMCEYDHKFWSDEADEQNQLEIRAMSHGGGEANPREEAILMKMRPSIEDLCSFFEIKMPERKKYEPEKEDRIHIKEKLQSAFSQAIDECCQFFTTTEPTIQDVHFRLIMFGFIDFMYNRIALNYPYCQSRRILEDVYPGEVTTAVGIKVYKFENFRSFLQEFKLRTLPSSHNLAWVAANIKDILKPCPSGARIEQSQLKPDWNSLRKVISLRPPRQASRKRPSENPKNRSGVTKKKQNESATDPGKPVNPDEIGDEMNDEEYESKSPPYRYRTLESPRTHIPPQRSAFRTLLSSIGSSRLNPRNWSSRLHPRNWSSSLHPRNWSSVFHKKGGTRKIKGIRIRKSRRNSKKYH